MATMSPKLLSVFNDAYGKIRTGELKTLIPFLSLFRLNGNPMNLKLHYQFAPLYNTVQPAHTVVMTGRQVGKSYAICSDTALRNMLIPYYHTLIVQPRADQVQRLIGTVYKPLLSSCPIWDQFITSVELQKLALRQFKSGSLCYAEHMFESPDRVRGISGVASCVYDETVSASTPILYAEFTPNMVVKSKPICDIKRGDFVFSFVNDITDAIVLSVAAKDASYHGVRQYYKITTLSGRELTCTADHSLHTSAGRMHLSEIIDYEFEQRHTDQRASTECDHGQPAWGCGLRSPVLGGLRNTLESRILPDGLRDAQVQHITRIRSSATAEATESRIRRILGELEPTQPWCISLAILADASGRYDRKACDEDVPGADNASDSPGLVVHGRRIAAEGQELRNDLHERFSETGSRASGGMASHKMESGCTTKAGDSSEREARIRAISSPGSVYTSDGFDTGLCSGVHEVQNCSADGNLSCVRNRIPEDDKKVLFSFLRGSALESCEEAVRGAEQGPYTCAVEAVEGAPQGRDQCCCTRALCVDDAVAAGCAAGIFPHVPGEEQGRQERVQTPVACSEEVGSSVHGAAEVGTQGLLGAAEAGSGALCTSSCPEQGLQEAGLCPRQGSGVPAPVQGQAAGEGSGEEGGARCNGGAQGGGVGDDPGTASAAYQGHEPGELLQAQVGDDCGGMGCQERTHTGDSAEAHGGHQGGSGEACEVESGREAPQGCKEGEEGGFFWDPILKIECVGELPGYDIEVEGTHNYILANGICSYNCQDLEYEYLDIASEVMSASLFWGFARYTGTPKTTDTTLALLWNRSSQAEWVIRCGHCGHYNVPNPDHDLLKMIGKHGPVCARCGLPVYPQDGGYVHAIPDRMTKFPGYHVSQTVHPLHMISQAKWNKLLDKIETYPELTLYNEVYGWPFDAATSPLTMSDMQKATHDIKVDSLQDFEKVADQYSYVTVAVDWSGGGMISDSYTSYAVLGLRVDAPDVIDVIYGKRIPKGRTPTEEADEIMSWIRGTGADAYAYDAGGGGYVRQEIMNHAGLHEIDGLTIVPINYVRPRSGDVMAPRTGQREADMYYYTLDKSRSLAICISSIKANRIRFPKFSETDESAYQRDFLALREDPRESLGNETVILIIKKPGVPDDFAHAVNFGCSQIWDHFGAYPRIGHRYDASVLDFDENHNKILEDDTFGPRGDFERFRDAVDQRSELIESEEDWY